MIHDLTLRAGSWKLEREAGGWKRKQLGTASALGTDRSSNTGILDKAAASAVTFVST